MGLSNFTGSSSQGSNTSSGSNPPQGGSGIPFPFGALTSQTSNIDATEMLINYNERFKAAGPTLFRDALVEQTIAVLLGKNKPNALLVGPAGCGKTKIVEDIAYRLASDDAVIPQQLKGFTIYELPLANIVSGSSYVGDLEAKTQAVLEFASDASNKAILFIDEVHLLMGSPQTYGKIAQILKPALARGDIRVIGATTIQEAKSVDDDPAFKRRFSRLIVDELTPEQTLAVLIAMKPHYEKHYNFQVVIDESMLPGVVATADAYGTSGNHRPDSALTLLDRAIGDAIVTRKVMEKKAASDPALLAAIQANPAIVVSETAMKRTALRLATGQATPPDFDETRVKEALSRIKGQDAIIEAVLKMLRRKNLDLFPKSTPDAYIFAGPSGVGKTEVTKIIAQELTDEDPIILNMTEFHSSASINRIIGAPAGYIGSDSNAELVFDCLSTNPYKVILLDEFEKADRAVQRLFMSALDEGFIKTNRGNTIDFSKSIIIATTNAGHSYGAQTGSLGFAPQANDSKIAATVDTLSNWFDVELINRFSGVLTFAHITRESYKEIVADTYVREVARIKESKPYIALDDTMPDDEIERIVCDTYVDKLGARPAKRAVSEYIEEKVYATQP